MRNIPSLKRSVGKRGTGKRTFYLICEGSKTEYDYFTALKGSLDASILSVLDIEIDGGAGVPLTIAEKAALLSEQKGLSKKSRKRLDTYEKGDEVWAVFDRDEFPNYNQALSVCNDHGVHVARSNPCFEVWLLLHFDTYDRDEHRHKTQKALEAVCPEYDKHRRKTADCKKLVLQVEQAELRASKQLARRSEEGGEMNAPSTTVHLLTRKIRGAA